MPCRTSEMTPRRAASIGSFAVRKNRLMTHLAGHGPAPHLKLTHYRLTFC
jgi:hypothetical protein